MIEFRECDPEQVNGDPESYDEYPESDQGAERRYEDERPPHHSP